jgi:AcrR family transcriptional regulator
MARPGPTSQLARERDATRTTITRNLLVDAAIQGLVEDGFLGASARSIAERAGVNQGLVFYHFGSVAGLLLAALDKVSDERRASYGAAVATASGPAELCDVAAQVFRHDLDAGYVKVLAEMITGAGSSDELRAEVNARLQPWFAFAQDAIDGAVPPALGALLPTGDLAYGVVALYLGLELLTHLDGDDATALRLFTLASRLAALAVPDPTVPDPTVPYPKVPDPTPTEAAR